VSETEPIRQRLLDWYRRDHRDLPWRRTRDPYGVWVSEIMLQQTRVETVEPRWRRFMERFPTVTALAEAPADDVLGEWSGLGYYARARHLHQAAREVVERYGGQIPDEPEAVRALPGVGRYTAGAILSIAFGRPEPLVDGNVERVLSRLFLVEGDVRKQPAREKLWALATGLAQGEAPGDLNQSLMELGARICTPRAPTCLLCPVRDHCQARAAGRAEELPLKAKKAPTQKLHVAWAVIYRPRPPGALLLWRRPADVGLFGGLWEPPSMEMARGESARAAVARLGGETLGSSLEPVRVLRPLHQELSHRSLTVHPVEAEFGARRARSSVAGRYDAIKAVTPAAASRLGLSALTTRLLEHLARSPRSR
jgi:A/G-specific adenine glycosylase